jgi:phospholipase/carboxylesterase
MIALAPAWQHALPDALFLTPNGSERWAGVPGGYQWFGLYSLAHDALSAGARRAAPTLDAYIDQPLAETGLGEENLLLVAFSQGTMMALHVGPLRRRPVAGIVGYSGVLAVPHVGGVAGQPPVLLIHGAADSVVPIAGHRQTHRELRRLGFAVESVVAPGWTMAWTPTACGAGRSSRGGCWGRRGRIIPCRCSMAVAEMASAPCSPCCGSDGGSRSAEYRPQASSR